MAKLALTPRDFARPEIVAAAREVIAARALYAVLRPEVDAIDRRVLAEVPLYTNTSRKRYGPRRRITEPSQTYLGEESGLPGYYAARRAALDAAGYDTTGDTCPALVANHNIIKAEWELIDRVSKLPGLEHVTSQRLYGKDRDEYIELCLKLAISQGVPTHA